MASHLPPRRRGVLNERVAAGAVGGFMPALLKLARYDPSTIFTDIDLQALGGIAFWGLVLAIVGATVAYYNHSERQLWKLFVLGMTAPAMLTGFVSARQIPPDAKSLKRAPGAQNMPSLKLPTYAGLAQAFDVPLGTARPVADPQDSLVVVHAIPADGTLDKFWRGFVGAPRKAGWFVVEGVYDDPAEAASRRNTLSTQLKPTDRLVVVEKLEPFIGARKARYLLLGLQDNPHKISFIADDLKDVAFSNEAAAREVGREVERIIKRPLALGTQRYVQ